MTIRRGLDGAADDFRAQRAFVEKTVPVYARVLDAAVTLLDGPIGRRLAEAWEAREFLAVYERPLLLMAALRFDALLEGPSHPLFRAIAHDPPDVSAVTPDALAAALAPDRSRVYDALARRVVQTNETSRAIAWLWPAHLLREADATTRVILIDLGASAGLNLIGDALPLPWIDPSGRPIPLQPLPHIEARLGFDKSPLDVRKADSAMWLRACVWPGQVERLDRLNAAIAAFTDAMACGDRPHVDACDLADVPGHLQRLPDTMIVVAYQSLVRDYLPAADRERYETGMREWLIARGPGKTIWSTLELADGGSGAAATPDTSTAIVVTAVDRGGALRSFELARCHPHPRVIATNDAAVAAFVAMLAGA